MFLGFFFGFFWVFSFFGFFDFFWFFGFLVFWEFLLGCKTQKQVKSLYPALSESPPPLFFAPRVFITPKILAPFFYPLYSLPASVVRLCVAIL